MKHDLKILKPFFEAVIRGEKSFEIRDNSDRGFQKGDCVELHEIHKNGNRTDRSQLIDISYVSDYNQPQNQVVFGFSLVGDPLIQK